MWSLLRSFAFAAAVVVLLAGTGCGSGEGSVTASQGATPSNLSVARGLVAGLGRSVIDSTLRGDVDTVALDVDSSAASWIARAELASALGSTGARVVIGAPSTGWPHPRWSVRGLTLGVEYRDTRKHGIFSDAVVDRIVTASFTSEITVGGNVIFAGTTSRSETDTVEERRITELETGSTHLMRGAVPDLRSFDRFIEPFVIIGATGAAILLFFQVRS